MRGALNDFTTDCKVPLPPGRSAAARTIEGKKAPYPPAVYIESDDSISPSLDGQAHYYSDVSELALPFLPMATPSSAFPHPPHIQQPPAQPQSSKINITSAHSPLESQSPCQPEHCGHCMLLTNPLPPPAPHNLRRVSFQHPPARKQYQQQAFERLPDSDESKWWRGGESGEEGGVELDTGVGMGVVDPPLRRRI